LGGGWRLFPRGNHQAGVGAGSQSRARPAWRSKIRSLESETATNTLPGAPDGQYEVLRFQSAFANKAAAVEILTLKREGDAWKVAGYFIK
jgi:hypothetical protein